MAIQFSPYEDGTGFMLLNIPDFPGKRMVRAFYNANGVLTGSEYRDARMNIRSLRAKEDLNKLRGMGLAFFLTHTEAGRVVWAETCDKYGVAA